MLITVRASHVLTWSGLMIAIGAGLGYQGNREMAARWEAEAYSSNAAVVEARKEVAASRELVARSNVAIAKLQAIAKRQEARDESRETRESVIALGNFLLGLALGLGVTAIEQYVARRRRRRIRLVNPGGGPISVSIKPAQVKEPNETPQHWTPQEWNSFLKEARLVRRS
jgi:hypothetical protein